MTCPIRAEIDLEAYLIEPAAPAWEAFRAHVPTCPECSAEWMNGTAGFPILLQLPFRSSVTCRSCGHTVNAKNFA